MLHVAAAAAERGTPAGGQSQGETRTHAHTPRNTCNTAYHARNSLANKVQLEAITQTISRGRRQTLSPHSLSLSFSLSVRVLLLHVFCEKGSYRGVRLAASSLALFLWWQSSCSVLPQKGSGTKHEAKHRTKLPYHTPSQANKGRERHARLCRSTQNGRSSISH